MSKERYNQIVDEVYRNYADSHWIPSLDQLWRLKPMQHSKESFIHEIKTNPEFSEKWGLKIEEKVLTTVKERKKYDKYFDDLIGEYPEHHETLDKRGVPRKIIIVTFDNEKIEVYE